MIKLRKRNIKYYVKPKCHPLNTRLMSVHLDWGKIEDQPNKIYYLPYPVAYKS